MKRSYRVWSPDSELTYARNRIERACPENQPNLKQFADWMRDERGLAPATITIRLGTACTFVDEVTNHGGWSVVQAFESLTPAGVEDSFVHYCKDHGPGARRSMQASMRLFLIFAASRGWSGAELAEAVPSFPVYRLSSLPSGVSDDELSTVLSAPWVEGGCPLRNRAIVLLLATYGVRRSQVSSLQFEDIDWYQRTILFAAHKGGKAIYHDLTQATAESLADYLRIERPTSDCNYIFLRHRKPHVRLNPEAVSALVRVRMESLGLPPRYPHSFRHAFATRLLRSGQPVKAIADLLGHRSLDSVAIYAKVDHARLLEVAIDWPEVAL